MKSLIIEKKAKKSLFFFGGLNFTGLRTLFHVKHLWITGKNILENCEKKH